MVTLVIIGYATIIGVVIIAAIETKRMEKGQPAIILSKKDDKSGKNHSR